MKSVRSTPSLAFAILAALALLLVALAIAPRAQTQMAAPAPVAYEQVVEQLKKQQETMVANQAKMDEQISNIKEEIPLDPHLQQKGAAGGGGG